MKKRLLYLLMNIIGIVFLCFYLYRSTLNIVYSDYIRIINSYLPDYNNFNKLITPDILTRIPLSYIFRYINCKFFYFNTQFDMLLGLLGIFFICNIILRFSYKNNFTIIFNCVIIIVCYSLNKWEMITNGTGNVHFWAISATVYTFYLADKCYMLNSEVSYRYHLHLLYILPTFITFTVAGDYCVPFLGTLLIFYSFLLMKNFKKHRLYLILSVVLPFGLYVLSRSFAVYNISGASKLSLIEIMKIKPYFIVIFFIKSLASTLISENLFQWFNLRYSQIIIGVAMLLIYIVGIYCYFHYKLYKRSILPLLLILYSIISYILIFKARWVFNNTNYGMSSRYQLQYQLGVIGVVLVMGLYHKYINKKSLMVFSIVLSIIFSNIATSINEWMISPWRKEYSQNLIYVAKEIETYSDQELKHVFQYGDANKIKEAFKILKESGLNIFR